MKNFRVAFEAWEEGSFEDARRGQNLFGYQEICCHIIFNMNMDKQFTRKACYVAGGHNTDPPSSITYSSIVSIYSNNGLPEDRKSVVQAVIRK